MGIIKRNSLKSSQSEKERQIKLLNYELEECKIDIKQTIEKINITDNPVFKKSLLGNLEAYNQKKHTTFKKLNYLGVKSENRGRPTKPNAKKYSNTHKKFTAMLNPNNLKYLQQLKATKKIKSISLFLDILIEQYSRDNPI